MNQGESKRLVESERQLEQQLERGDRHRLRPGGQMYGFKGAVYVMWYVLLAVAAVSAVYHLLLT